MKLVTSVSLLLVLSTLTAFAKDKKKNVLPAVFNSATYVYVQAEDGDILNPNLFPEDRQAISDVENGLRDWDRYVLTINQNEADLVFIVRKGREVAAKVRGMVGAGTQPYPRNNPAGPGGSNPGQQNPNPGQQGTTYGYGVGAEAGMPDDTLRVFTLTPDKKLSGSPIWWREMKDGLDSPDLPLLSQLREAVDRDYPPQPTKKASTSKP
jgi:hypothetical protein